MRNLLVASLVVGLLAVPSLGIINIKLTADGPIMDGKVQLNNGQTTTVYLWGQATTGLASLGADIKAGTNDPVVLTANAGSLIFGPDFTFDPAAPYSPQPFVVGTSGPNGGWSIFGASQTKLQYLQVDPSVGASPGWALFCRYTVSATPMGMGDVPLTFASRSVSGNKPIETDKTGIIGSNTPLTIHVVPEPLTLTLLALAGLLAARRRR